MRDAFASPLACSLGQARAACADTLQTALRAFEAAARHLSLTMAAAELHVTPAAVSHQVKALEENLGEKLLRRAGRNLMLTDAGELLKSPVGDALDRMLAGVERVRELTGTQLLTVSVP